MNGTSANLPGPYSLTARAAAADLEAAAVNAWSCDQCGAGYFSTVPDDGLCPGCGSADAAVLSFGYGHRSPPAAHLLVDLVDVREHYRDPHVCPGLRELTD